MSTAWIQTYTGRAFPVLDSQPEHVDLEDIAHALSNLCRFTGHVSDFYSVAQHSVLVSRHVAPELALQALLHDAPEAYIGDMNRPLKHSGAVEGYRRAEELIWYSIALRFNVPVAIHPDVKTADNRALFTEQRDLMSRSPKPWSDPHPPFDEAIRPLSPRGARELFLHRFHVLSGDRS